MALTFSREAERHLLGSLIQDANKRLDLANKINASDLYLDKHKKIYNAIYDIENNADQTPDVVTISEHLRDEIENISSYLVSITNQLATTENAESYADVVTEKATRRRMLKAANKINKLASNNDMEVEKALANAEQMLFDLNNESNVNRDFQNISDFIGEHFESFFEEEEKGERLETPFRALNNTIGGLYGGELTILSGRPGMGKTSLALNISNYIALEEEVPVGLFSLEMNRKKLTNRTIASETEIEYQKLKRKTFNEKEQEVISDFVGKVHELGTINIKDNAGQTIEEIRSSARKAKKNQDIELFVIDYGGLICGGKGETEALRLQKIARSIRNMAKELDVHVILLHQLSRSVEQRNDKRPKMSDLKGSSGLEDAADLILFIYRESEYNKQMPDRIKNIAELIIGKGRETSKGTALLEFDGRFYNFSDANRSKGEEYRRWLGSD